MQVSKFISGSKTARLRDMNIPELSQDVAKMVFDRMGSSSLSFIVSQNLDIWDFDEVLSEEKKQLELGISRFVNYYQIPETVDPMDQEKVLEHAFVYFPKQKDYVHTQLRGFKNKLQILSSLDIGNETRD
jgi:asparagine synthetase A